MKLLLMFVGLAALWGRTPALRLHFPHGVPLLHDRAGSAGSAVSPVWDDVFARQWGGLAEQLAGFEHLTNAFRGSPLFADDALWPELAGSKGREEIKWSCLDRQEASSQPRPGSGGGTAGGEGRSADHAPHAARDPTADAVQRWEKQQVEQWERNARDNREQWERRQAEESGRFYRQLEAEKRARVEQERAHRRVEKERAEHQARVEKQKQDIDRQIKEAERQRHEAEERLQRLRQPASPPAPQSRHHTHPAPQTRHHTPSEPQTTHHTPSEPQTTHHTPSEPQTRHHTPGEPQTRHHTTPAPVVPERTEPAAKRARILKMGDPVTSVGGPSEILSLYVSGYKPEEVSVKLDGEKVRITGRHTSKDEQSGCLVSEFDRTYLLPDGVDKNSIRASFSSGVLKLEGNTQHERPPPASSRPAAGEDDRADMERSSVVTRDSNSVRESRLNGLKRGHDDKDTTVQHSIYRHNMAREDDDVTIDVVE